MRTSNTQVISRVLECVKKHQLETGRSPSYREIMRLCRIASIGQVQRAVRALIANGDLEGAPDGTIALDVRFGGGYKSIPLVGTVACGGPITAIENLEEVYRFSEELVGSGEHFMMYAKGSSMKDAGIFDGDLLIIRSQTIAESGQIVVALIDDEATVKTFCPKPDGRIILKAENPDYEDIAVGAKDCRIAGVLVGSYRRY